MSNVFQRLLSKKELDTRNSLLQGREADLTILGWQSTYSIENPDDEGFINVTGDLPMLHTESPVLEGGRKAFNKASGKLRKKLQKEMEGIVIATPFIMQRLSLYGAWLVCEGYTQFHATLSLEGERIPLHFWAKSGPVFLPKLKISNEAQYWACLSAGLI